MRNRVAAYFTDAANTAHMYSANHRKQIEASDLCGCFYCLKIFAPAEILEWVDNESTALCPRCGVDSVIGNRSGVPITSGFLICST